MQHRLSARRAFALALASTSLLAAGRASAQRMPDMSTLDRGDGISRVGLDFTASFVDDEFAPIDAALRFEFFGQFVNRDGLGVYGALPLSRLVAEGEDESALGNLEIGGLYVVESPAISYVFRAGLSLPTGDDDLAGALVNLVSTWGRVTDLALAVPDATYVRLAFSPLYHANRLFLRADLGFDLAVDDDEGALGIQPESLVRINVGGGIDLGTVALMAELVNLASTDSFDDEDDEDFVHTFAVTARFMGEALQPYLTLGAPVDDYSGEVIDFFLGAGLQVAF